MPLEDGRLVIPRATASSYGGGDYYDADAVPNAENTVYAIPLDDNVTREARNQPNLLQVSGDDNGHNSAADNNSGTAA